MTGTGGRQPASPDGLAVGNAGVYVVAVYGDRFDPETGELVLGCIVRAHLEALSELGCGRFASALFVVNTDSPSMVEIELERASLGLRGSFAETESDSELPYAVLIRAN